MNQRTVTVPTGHQAFVRPIDGHPVVVVQGQQRIVVPPGHEAASDGKTVKARKVRKTSR